MHHGACKFCLSCLSKAIPGIPSFYVASRSWHVGANAERARVDIVTLFAEMRSAIAHRVAHHAQAAGLAAGDDGARLLGDSQPLKPGTHKVRGVRLLRDSPAANLSADLFNAAVEKI